MDDGGPRALGRPRTGERHRPGDPSARWKHGRGTGGGDKGTSLHHPGDYRRVGLRGGRRLEAGSSTAPVAAGVFAGPPAVASEPREPAAALAGLTPPLARAG